jgi:hypothetical protein
MILVLDILVNRIVRETGQRKSSAGEKNLYLVSG